jgi:hypothetical protein
MSEQMFNIGSQISRTMKNEGEMDLIACGSQAAIFAHLPLTNVTTFVNVMLRKSEIGEFSPMCCRYSYQIVAALANNRRRRQ